jgi:hypothetical protein
VAPEETAATAPVDNDSAASTTSGVEKDARFFHYYAPHAPPAARFEIAGRAPSARHFWAPGYYRYNGREHVWVGDQRRREGFVRHPLLRSLRSARGPLRVPRRRPERAALLGARLLPLQRPRARLGRRPLGAAARRLRLRRPALGPPLRPVRVPPRPLDPALLVSPARSSARVSTAGAPASRRPARRSARALRSGKSRRDAGAPMR